MPEKWEKNGVYINCACCWKLVYKMKSKVRPKINFCSTECRDGYYKVKYKPWTKYWKLTIIEAYKDKYIYLRCICECWKESIILANNRWKSNSCWCLWWSRHWMSFSPEYSSWRSIVKRCTEKSTPSYERYGARWIKVWFKNFDEFYAYMWPRPWKEYTVDRIDNSKWYEPWNVRWATMKEQSNNKTNNVICVINWETHTLQERADKLWIKRWTLKKHILNWKIKWKLYNYKYKWEWH